MGVLFLLMACGVGAKPEGAPDPADCAPAEGGEGTPTHPWYRDDDGDGYGTEVVASCTAPEGYSALGGDCDDQAPGVNPGAVEVCDGVDQDCDAVADEDAVDAVVWHLDADGDGFGDPQEGGVGCEVPEGATTDGRDCNDGLAAVHPAAREDCATWYDDNCDDALDAMDARGCDPWYVDADRDSFGDPDDSQCRCAALPPYTARRGNDCGPDDPTISPTATEVCDDGIDQDCDGADLCHPDQLAIVALGTAASGDFGMGAVYGADVTGDGVGDLVVADSLCHESEGCAFVYPGPLGAGPVGPTFELSGGVPEGSRYGESLAVADLDGDGVADIVGGTTWANWGDRRSAGVVLVHHGPILADTWTGAPDLAVYGMAEARIGGIAATVADADGDGIAELAVGSSGVGEHGRIVLVPGDRTGPVSLDRVPTGFLGAGDRDDCCASVVGADWSGDGITDVALGIPDASDHGRVVLFVGPVAGLSSLDDGDGLWVGDVGSAGLGSQVLAPGDVDGDGVDDLLARGEPEVLLLTDLGSGRHDAGEATASFVGLADGDPTTVSRGDYDGDTVSDLLLATEGTVAHRAGVALLFLGPFHGAYTPADSPWGLVGDAAEMVSGEVGDLDGDGRDDALVSSPRSSSLGGRGYVALVPGSVVP